MRAEGLEPPTTCGTGTSGVSASSAAAPVIVAVALRRRPSRSRSPRARRAAPVARGDDATECCRSASARGVQRTCVRCSHVLRRRADVGRVVQNEQRDTRTRPRPPRRGLRHSLHVRRVGCRSPRRNAAAGFLAVPLSVAACEHGASMRARPGLVLDGATSSACRWIGHAAHRVPEVTGFGSMPRRRAVAAGRASGASRVESAIARTRQAHDDLGMSGGRTRTPKPCGTGT